MRACDEGYLDIVKTLIEAGANVNHTNKVGKMLYVHIFLVHVYHRLVYTCCRF